LNTKPEKGKEKEMKITITIMLTLALAAISGCQSSSSARGGGMTRDVGFKIAVPTYDTEVKQGEVRTVTVSLKRGDFFKQDVRLQINTTKGISVDPTNILVKANEKPDVQLQITVPKDAAFGEYSVSVKGTPETGEPTSTSFDVKVVSP
jgi:uncharacterized membrane protein